MNLKTLGIVMVVSAGAAAVAYNMGTKQATAPATQEQSPPATAAQQPVPAAQPATAPQPMPGQGPVDLSGQMPSNHPTYDRFTHFQVGNRNVKSIIADGDFVWIGTSGGVVRYNIKTEEHTMFNVDSGALLSNGVFHVSKLGEKIVVGTYGGGMSVLNPKTSQWKNYNIPQGLADQFVYDVLQAKNGDVWIATWSGANRIKGGDLDDPKKWETFTVKNTNNGLPNDWVYGLEEGKNGDIWIGTEGGLALYRNGTWKQWAHGQGLGAPYEQVKKDISVTTDPGSASKHHARQKMEQGLEDVNIAYNPNYIISMAVDGQGNVWCGTWGGGLSRFDGKNWKTFTVTDGLPANHIFMLYIDEKGTLWVGTNHGMARYNGEGKGFAVKTQVDGLYSDNVFSMATASDGSTWVGSFGGVAQIRDLK